jgi:hypothetical protein
LITSPADGARVSTATAAVTGTVSPPGATLLILGHPVPLGRGGAFSTEVPLAPGTNLVDVLAGAPHAQPAMSAITIVRYVLVGVPSVAGEGPRVAAAQIRAAGLVPDVKPSGNPFDFLLPVPDQICATNPSAGTRVTPGSTVTLITGKLC